LGLGLLGLTPDALYDFTFRQFGNAVRGRYKLQESQHRDAWERTRWQTALLLNVHTKKGASQEKKDPQHGWNQLKAFATNKDG
jgi:hypothetical protein